ncbi:hypothetical protein LI221_08570 [Faecalimonas umbilicata]|nr:hypothetical protein [Faecalimonas umbilicata]
MTEYREIILLTDLGFPLLLQKNPLIICKIIGVLVIILLLIIHTLLIPNVFTADFDIYAGNNNGNI